MSKNKKEIPRSATKLVNIILDTPGLIDKSNPDAAKTIHKIADDIIADLPTPALIADKWIYRGVIIVVGLVAIITVLGVVFLGIYKIDIPETLTALGSAAIGALAGLLAPSPVEK